VIKLKDTAQESGMIFGVTVGVNALRNDDWCRETILRECSVIVAENAMKFGPRSPNPDHLRMGRSTR
jgi:GH35 family endo-1,4-beta-xylanase